MSYRLTMFDGLAIPQAAGLGGMDIAAGAVSAPLVQLPGGRVLDPLGTSVALRSSALFTAHIILVSSVAATRQALLDAWQAKVGVVGVLTRVGDGGTVETITARLISASAQHFAANIQNMPVPLVFQAISFPWAGAGNAPVLPTLVISSNNYVTVVTNNGNARQKNLIFTFINTHATVNLIQLFVVNTTLGYGLRSDGLVIPTGNIVINTGARSILRNGVGDYANLVIYGTAREEWLSLAPGANTITITPVFAGAVNGQVTCALAFNDAWA